MSEAEQIIELFDNYLARQEKTKAIKARYLKGHYAQSKTMLVRRGYLRAIKDMRHALRHTIRITPDSRRESDR